MSLQYAWEKIGHIIINLIFGMMVIYALFFSPLIRWEGGFYNIEIIITLSLMILYMIWKTYYNTILIKNQLIEIRKALK